MGEGIESGGGHREWGRAEVIESGGAEGIESGGGVEVIESGGGRGH